MSPLLKAFSVITLKHSSGDVPLVQCGGNVESRGMDLDRPIKSHDSYIFGRAIPYSHSSQLLANAFPCKSACINRITELSTRNNLLLINLLQSGPK